MVTLRFTPTVVDGDRFYIDLAQCLSIVNRRFQRQHQLFTVRGGAVHDSNQAAYVKFNTVIDNWAVRRALRRGKQIWDQQFEEILKNNPSMRPRYHDYKVYLSNDHRITGNMTPVDSQEPSGTPYNVGEWVYSRYFSEDIDWNSATLLTLTNRNADDFTSHITGNHVGSASNWTSIGLIKSWADSAGRENVTNPVMSPSAQSDPLTNLFDEADADDEKIASLDVDNDQAPYDSGVVPGQNTNALHRQAFAACSSGAGSISYFNGFQALCGLIEVDFTVSQSGVVEILLDVEIKGEKI